MALTAPFFHFFHIFLLVTCFLHNYVMNGVFLHSLTFCLSGTSALVLALRGVEGVAQRDVQTVVAACLTFPVGVSAAVLTHILNTTLEHIVDRGTQTEGIVLQPTLLNGKAEIV